MKRNKTTILSYGGKFMKFNVTFCRNNNDAITIDVEADSFDKARKIARKKVNEMGYVGKNGWKWKSTRRIV